MLEGGSCRVEGLSVDRTRIEGVITRELYNHLSNVGLFRKYLNYTITPSITKIGILPHPGNTVCPPIPEQDGVLDC